MMGESRWGQIVDLSDQYEKLLSQLFVEQTYGGLQLDSAEGPGADDIVGLNVAQLYNTTARELAISVRQRIDLPDATPDPNVGEPIITMAIQRGAGRAAIQDEFVPRAVGQVIRVGAQAPTIGFRVGLLRLFPILPNALPVNPRIEISATPGRPSPWSTTRPATNTGDGIFEIDILPYTEAITWQASNLADVPVPYRAIWLSSRGFELGGVGEGSAGAEPRTPRVKAYVPTFATRLRFFPETRALANNLNVTFHGMR